MDDELLRIFSEYTLEKEGLQDGSNLGDVDTLWTARLKVKDASSCTRYFHWTQLIPLKLIGFQGQDWKESTIPEMCKGLSKYKSHESVKYLFTSGGVNSILIRVPNCMDCRQPLGAVGLQAGYWSIKPRGLACSPRVLKIPAVGMT